MHIRCIVIDDEPPALALMREYISRFPVLELVQSFDDAVSAGEFLRKHPVDLLFADINMPDISGIDLVRSLEDKPMIIFTTAHRKFAVEGFELDAVDYLLKPIQFDRFSKAVHKAEEYFKFKRSADTEEPKYLFVYAEYRLIKIPLTDILYIESLQDYCKIHIEKDKPVLTLMPLKKLLEKLPASQFKRIHRSYIIPVDRVKSVLNRKVQLGDSIELPVSDSYLDFINEWKKG
ncbi:MAG: response regulator transcription factor [Bacteroidetes bacterium]|nr:response regulator transcription factor [Bacteroidota bacterium]